tara:strand:- start:379 stop:576 length:198 start_codon:yes stop_codon:yes gene_type:complete
MMVFPMELLEELEDQVEVVVTEWLVDQLINHHNQEFLQHMGMEMLVVDIVLPVAVVVLEVVVPVV